MKYYLRYVNFAAKRPWWLILLTALVIVAGLPTLNIKVANHAEDWYTENSRQLPDKKEFEKYFGNDEVMVLFLTFPKDSSDDYKLDQLYAISENINKIKGFDGTFSRLNTSSLYGLMSDQYVNKLERLYFNASNPSGEAIFLKLKSNTAPDKIRPLLIDSLQRLVYPHIASSIKKDLTGAGVIFTEINRLSTQDSTALFVSCYLLIFFLLWWRLRKVKYLLLCSALAMLAMWPAMSLFDWLNVPINMMTLIVPLLFVINFYSFAMHLVTKQSVETTEYINKKIPPIFTSALSNIIGFGSLMLSDIKVIYQFGLLTSVGIIAGLIILFLIGTPLIVRSIAINKNIEKIDWMNKLLDSYYKILSKKLAYLTVSIMLIWMLVSYIIFPNIKIDTDSLNFIKADNSARISKEYIEKNYGAVNTIDFLIDKTNGKIFTNEDWKSITTIRKQLLTLPFIESAISYDVWRPLVNEMGNSKEAEKISRSFLSKDKMHARITLRIPAGSVKEMERMINEAQLKINQNIGSAPISARAVGYLSAYIEQMNVVVDEMIESLIIALILILVLMALFVRDVKLALLATFATIFPLTAVVLLMHWLDIPFDIATSVIFSVVVGMVADDILHIIWNFKNNLPYRKEISTNILFADSIRAIVHPCTATTIMFAIGFAVLLSSDIVFIIDFGILSTSAIIFAWISDFIFFPALLQIFYKKK